VRKPDSIRRLSCDARTPSKEHSDSRTGIRVCVCVCVCVFAILNGSRALCPGLVRRSLGQRVLPRTRCRHRAEDT